MSRFDSLSAEAQFAIHERRSLADLDGTRDELDVATACIYMHARMHACMLDRESAAQVFNIICAGLYSARDSLCARRYSFSVHMHAECPTKIQQCKRFLVNILDDLHDNVHTRDVWCHDRNFVFVCCLYIAYICIFFKV